MTAIKIVSICLLLTFGVRSQNAESTTFPPTTDLEIQFSTENVTIDLAGSSSETSEEPEVTNQTDIDTNGDIIFTIDPEEETENDHSSNITSTLVERNETDTTTEISSTTLMEITTVKTTWRACSSNPCKNGGSCSDDPSDLRLYDCKCTPGYTGTHCQVADSCLVDKEGNICSGGACVYEKDGISRFCTCFFGMFWDEDMKKCRKEDAPCFPNPCHNGTCIPDGEVFQCSCKSGYEGKTCEIHNTCGKDDYCENGECKKDSKKKIKYCKCHSDFYWDEDKQRCEAIERPCVPNPCTNGGTCKPVSTEEFNCTCAKGYLGKNCEIQSFCIITDSDGDLQCENGVCIDSGLSKICKCNEGYFWDQGSHMCREIMEPCLPNPCANDGKCTLNSTDSFVCSCSEGYSGSTCTERDYCSLKGGNTFCGVEHCKNEPSLKIYYCSCESGQYFDYGLRKCLDIDFCPLLECTENEECRESMCHCKEKYKRDNSTGECEPDFCPSNPCPVSDLTCIEGNGIDSYQCACPNGYAFDGKHCKAGATCLFPDLNACEQICMPEEDGYTCDCEDGFILNEDNRTCVYIGNSTNCSNKTCGDGVCISTEEDEKCICGPGYEESEGNCIDLYTAGHLPEGYCPNDQYEAIESGFRCKCEGKYTYSEDGITCKVRKMCDEGEVGWRTCSKRHALCVEDWSTADGFTCQCIEGQIATEGGFCRDICSLEENQRQCYILGAECGVNAKGEKTCKCPPYFFPFENGTACSKPASYSYLLTLPLNPSSYKENGRSKRSADMKFADVDYQTVQRDVRKAMEKLFPQLLYSNVLNCRENGDYVKCKVELQFVSIDNEDLKKLQLPGMCHSSSSVTSASACLIPPSLILREDYVKTVLSIQRTNPCEVDIKENLCGSESFCTSKPDESVFKCRCEAGFSFRGVMFPFGDSESFIENCKDIDECATENSCPENMDCHNSLGSYSCSCKPGYRAKDSLEPETGGCVEICNPNPCVHGDCVKTGDHSFECKCSPGYNGLFCDLQDENFKSAKTNTIIVGAVLGGCLLVVIILSIANISRLKKKKKMLENDRMLYGTEMTERRGGEAGAVNNAYQRD